MLGALALSGCDAIFGIADHSLGVPGPRTDAAGGSPEGGDRDAAQRDASGPDAPGLDAGGHDAGGHDAGGHDASGRDAGHRDSGAAHDACSAYCDPPATLVPTGTNTPVAAGLPSPTTLTDVGCPTGTVMVGVTGIITGGQAWGTLAAECATLEVGPPDGFAVTTRNATATPAQGDGTGTVTTTECPSGSVVTSFIAEVNGNGYQHNLDLKCTAVSIKYTAPDQYGFLFGEIATSLDAGSGPTTPMTPYTATCTDPHVARGIVVDLENAAGPLAAGLDCTLLASAPP